MREALLAICVIKVAPKSDEAWSAWQAGKSCNTCLRFKYSFAQFNTIAGVEKKWRKIY